MRAAPFHLLRQTVMRRLVAWVLILALPVNGLSSTLLHLLGAQHRHAQPILPAEMVEMVEMAEMTRALAGAEAGTGATWSARDIVERLVGHGAMEIIDSVHARQQGRERQRPSPLDFQPHIRMRHAETPAPHAHTHAAFERHHHDPRDGSVIPIGPTDTGHDGPGTAAGGLDTGGFLPIPVRPPQALTAFAARAAWAQMATQPWHSHVAPPPEHPPRA